MHLEDIVAIVSGTRGVIFQDDGQPFKRVRGCVVWKQENAKAYSQRGKDDGGSLHRQSIEVFLQQGKQKRSRSAGSSVK